MDTIFKQEFKKDNILNVTYFAQDVKQQHTVDSIGQWKSQTLKNNKEWLLNKRMQLKKTKLNFISYSETPNTCAQLKGGGGWAH